MPHFLLFRCSKNREVIKYDIKRWLDIILHEHHHIFFDLAYLIVFYKEFRNVFYLRLGRVSYFVRYLNRLSSLYIYTKSEDFGAGTFIQHGFSTIITAEKIGMDCWINQQVTIGYNNSKRNGLGKPVIGNNVRISSGAKVCGKITVGDNSTIGVNAVVIKDVPTDSIVVPSPMILIQERGEKTFKKL